MKLIYLAIVAILASVLSVSAAPTNFYNGGVTKVTNVTSYIVITTGGVTNDIASLTANLGDKISTNADTTAPHNYTFGGLIITNRIDTRVSTLYGAWTLGVLSNATIQIDSTGTNLLFIANNVTNRVNVTPQ